MSNSDTSPSVLRDVALRHGLTLAQLTAELSRSVKTSKSTVQYYWQGDDKNGGRLIGRKPWFRQAREVLMARGMTPEEAEDLFGAQRLTDLHEINERLRQIERSMVLVLQALKASPTKSPPRGE